MRFDEGPHGGYIAALVVNSVHGGPGRRREALRTGSLACGFRWRSADEAIQCAMSRARELMRSRSLMLTC